MVIHQQVQNNRTYIMYDIDSVILKAGFHKTFRRTF